MASHASGAHGELANAMIGAGTALLAKADDRVIGLSLCAAAIVSKIAAHLMNPK